MRHNGWQPFSASLAHGRSYNAGMITTAGLLLALALSASAPAAEEVVTLGATLDGWRKTGDWTTARGVALNTTNGHLFAIEPGDGVLVNGPVGKTVNLITQEEFGDIELHIEFCVSRKSNSGVYLMGRYEVQIYDSFGVAKDQYPGIECGGIYPRWSEQKKERVGGSSPRENASRPPGEWQSFDIVFRAPRFDADGRKTAPAQFSKVVHNGVTVHENVDVDGPTRAAMANDEKPAGPLMLQGDHGPVAYRNIRITPRRDDRAGR